MKFYILVLSLTFFGFSQNSKENIDLEKVGNKLSHNARFGFYGGFSAPTGDFGEHNPDKLESGYANTGAIFGINISPSIDPKISWSGDFGLVIHPNNIDSFSIRSSAIVKPSENFYTNLFALTGPEIQIFSTATSQVIFSSRFGITWAMSPFDGLNSGEVEPRLEIYTEDSFNFAYNFKLGLIIKKHLEFALSYLDLGRSKYESKALMWDNTNELDFYQNTSVITFTLGLNI
jgi:hypothetical protein